MRQPSTWRTAPAAQGSSPRGALRHARAPVPDTPPAPYPWATQAKTDPGSIRSAANFVKTVDSVPLGFLKLVSLVERAVLPAPQPTALASWSGLARLLAALGTPGERLGRSAVSGSPWCCLQPVVLPSARGAASSPWSRGRRCGPLHPPRLFDPLKSVLFPLLVASVIYRIRQCGDGACGGVESAVRLGYRQRHSPLQSTPSGPGRDAASSGLLSALGSIACATQSPTTVRPRHRGQPGTNSLTYAPSRMPRAGSCGAEAQAWAPEGGFGPQFVTFVQGLLQ